MSNHDVTPEDFHARIWEALAPVNSNDFQVVAAPAPDAAQVAAVQDAVTATIPEAVVAFAARTNGLAVIADPDAWPEPELFSVGPAWTFLRGVIMLGFDTDELPEWASIRVAAENLAAEGVTGVVPLFRIDGDGDRVWGVDEAGTSVLVTGDEVELLDATIADLYAEQIAELVERQQRIAAQGCPPPDPSAGEGIAAVGDPFQQRAQ